MARGKAGNKTVSKKNNNNKSARRKLRSKINNINAWQAQTLVQVLGIILTKEQFRVLVLEPIVGVCTRIMTAAGTKAARAANARKTSRRRRRPVPHSRKRSNISYETLETNPSAQLLEDSYTPLLNDDGRAD